MEFSVKPLLLLALIFATSVPCLEGRNIKNKPENYKPQNFFGYGGFYGNPMGPQLGFSAPGFGTVPIIGNAPFPGSGGVVGGGRLAVKP
ncbi:uncharacterized protein LOC122017611 [Zingiber officinale]|uniref:Glycine-rich protein n=1 Tax=Zingiber officinale TaxID=94328 RepID=A0A8J5F2F1_ZINOF|nr:uncharacterized protein LOC122012448 [Zingiber officinale]XP_042431198.1 uncharacterized protein LOC122017611 [Zingiber officinale]KAG6480642.1 hypothetical protein ZIOFF_057227 [Zingiber officinale]